MRQDCHSTVGTEFMFPPRDIAKLVMENPDPRAVLMSAALSVACCMLHVINKPDPLPVACCT